MSAFSILFDYLSKDYSGKNVVLFKGIPTFEMCMGIPYRWNALGYSLIGTLHIYMYINPIVWSVEKKSSITENI